MILGFSLFVALLFIGLGFYRYFSAPNKDGSLLLLISGGAMLLSLLIIWFYFIGAYLLLNSTNKNFSYHHKKVTQLIAKAEKQNDQTLARRAIVHAKIEFTIAAKGRDGDKQMGIAYRDLKRAEEVLQQIKQASVLAPSSIS